MEWKWVFWSNKELYKELEKVRDEVEEWKKGYWQLRSQLDGCRYKELRAEEEMCKMKEELHKLRAFLDIMKSQGVQVMGMPVKEAYEHLQRIGEKMHD